MAIHEDSAPRTPLTTLRLSPEPIFIFEKAKLSLQIVNGSNVMYKCEAYQWLASLSRLNQQFAISWPLEDALSILHRTHITALSICFAARVRYYATERERQLHCM